MTNRILKHLGVWADRAMIGAMALAVLLSCGGNDSNNADELEGREFLSMTITRDGQPHELVAGTRLRLSFHDPYKLGAHAGCNQICATYKIDGDSVSMVVEAITDMGCDQPLHDQDDWFAEFLKAAHTLTLEGESLIIESAGSRVEFLDKETADPDVDLDGPFWVVDTVIEGNAATNADWDPPATLKFGSEGIVEIFTGCNSGQAKYSVNETQMAFSDLTMTDKDCVDEAAEKLERAVLSVIDHQRSVAWKINSSRLDLNTDEVGLSLTVR